MATKGRANTSQEATANSRASGTRWAKEMKIPFIASTVILSACLAVHAELDEPDRPHGHRVDPVRRDVNRYLDLRDMTKDDRLLDHAIKQKTNSVAQWKKWKSERQAELGGRGVTSKDTRYGLT